MPYPHDADAEERNITDEGNQTYFEDDVKKDIVSDTEWEFEQLATENGSDDYCARNDSMIIAYSTPTLLTENAISLG